MIERLHQLCRQRRVLVVAILGVAVSGVVLGAVRYARRSPSLPTLEVKRGEFLDSLQFRGEVKALKSITISAPAEAGDLQIIKILPEGTPVNRGDVVVEFDRTKTEQELAQARSSLKSAEAEIEQAHAQARLAEEEDTTAVMKARYEVESAKLEASKQQILSRIEGEGAKLKVFDAEQKLHETEEKLKSDRALNKATIAGKEQASKKANYDAQRAERALTQMSLRAPSPGTISLLQHWAGSGFATYKPGDRAWPGTSLAELPDASTLRVSARVDETERGRLALKQPVTIRLDAIPDRQFTGHTEKISAIATLDFNSGWPLARNFTLEIVLDQTDSRFKPGLTAQLTVVVDRIPDALTIPAQALFRKSGQDTAYVWQGTQFEPRVVEVGRRSGDRVLVARGLQPGERVALGDPSPKEQ
jgi:HlyD family secretion protein